MKLSNHLINCDGASWNQFHLILHLLSSLLLCRSVFWPVMASWTVSSSDTKRSSAQKWAWYLSVMGGVGWGALKAGPFLKIYNCSWWLGERGFPRPLPSLAIYRQLTLAGEIDLFRSVLQQPINRPCSCKQSLAPLHVSNPRKTHNFTQLTWGELFSISILGALSGVSRHFVDFSEKGHPTTGLQSALFPFF